jgi:hypothetical protein
MINYLLLIILLLGTQALRSQQEPNRATEFGTFENGFMYHDSSMKQLQKMVEDQHIRFRNCSNNNIFNSIQQVKMRCFKIQVNKSIVKDICLKLDQQSPLTALLAEYDARFLKLDSTNQLLLDYGINEDNDRYYVGGPDEGFNADWALNKTAVNGITNRVFYTVDKVKGNEQLREINIRYFDGAFTSLPLPAKYAAYLNYVDCMVDTTTDIFLGTSGREHIRNDLPKYQNDVHNYIDKKRRVQRKEKYRFEILNSEQVNFAITQLSNDTIFLKLLSIAADSSCRNGDADETLEFLVGKLISRPLELELKRHRIVMGNCSQDPTPRDHARDIAVLAAETNKWDIFLRAHLNIMNDRFTRMSDGSYAWGRRLTYIRELEALDINVVDLMFGLTLRASNTSVHHYQGTIWRVGRAMSETKGRLKFEREIDLILKDPALDDFNRSLFFMLYRSYLAYLPDFHECNDKIMAMKAHQQDYPEILKTAIADTELREKDKN